MLIIGDARTTREQDISLARHLAEMNDGKEFVVLFMFSGTVLCDMNNELDLEVYTLAVKMGCLSQSIS